MIMAFMPSLLRLCAAIVSLGALGAPTSAFRAAPTIQMKRHVTPMRRDCAVARRRPSVGTTTTALGLSSEEEMMNRVLMEEQFRQGLVPPRGSEQQTTPAGAPARGVDPLIASLTRIDEPTPANVPTVQVPLFGEIPADGNLALLVPAAAIGILGFLFSIVVAFNSRDAIVEELSTVELPKMQYTPTVVDEGKCRGLCSSQDEDLDGLRNFMESISGKD
ncbi:hypothetical protein ACHAW5_002315 [Stephanodiscus triporus]|uniref:Transmembrane protein n=1 Tax=Stephanodiscus triporus TaxID=2934178 RepID=A0ABD3MLU1_9STRA